MNLLGFPDFYLKSRDFDFQKQQLELLMGKLSEGVPVFMTVEEKNKSKLELISFPIDNIDYRGAYNIRFYSNLEQVFVYDGQKNLVFYNSLVQNEYYELLKQNNTRYSFEDIMNFVDYGYSDYYGKAQHWFGTESDVEHTADLLYMDKVSRKGLHEAVILKKMDNFKEKYGYTNEILEKQLNEL